MMHRQKLIQIFFIGLIALLLISSTVAQIRAESSLDNLEIVFGSPSATLPLDRILKNRFPVKNTGDKTMVVEFGIYVKETNQVIVGWPQPQLLFLEPQEEKIVQTFLDENWGKLDRTSIGEHKRTVEWSFRDIY